MAIIDGDRMVHEFTDFWQAQYTLGLVGGFQIVDDENQLYF